MSMRIMAHLLGLKFPGVEASPFDGESWAGEAFDFQDPESAQIGQPTRQTVTEAGVNNAGMGSGMYQRLPDSFYREGGPVFTGYDFQSFTNPDVCL